eukprot:3151292-Pleurochrysis_carterae.AAC.4
MWPVWPGGDQTDTWCSHARVARSLVSFGSKQIETMKAEMSVLVGSDPGSVTTSDVFSPVLMAEKSGAPVLETAFHSNFVAFEKEPATRDTARCETISWTGCETISWRPVANSRTRMLTTRESRPGASG